HLGGHRRHRGLAADPGELAAPGADPLTARPRLILHATRKKTGTSDLRRTSLSRLPDPVPPRGRTRLVLILNHGVVAGPAVEDVLARSANEHIVAGLAVERVVAVAAEEDVVAVAAVGGELDRARRKAAGLDDVVAIESVDREAIVGGFGAGDIDQRRQPRDGGRAGSAGDADHIVAVRAFHNDVVRGAIACAAGEGGVQVDLGHARAGEIVNRDLVRAAEGVEVDRLDAVQIHGEGAHVAGEADALTIRRDVDLLVDGGAVEVHGIEAVLAFDDVAAVTRIPDESVVAGAHESHVVAGAADDLVVALAADQEIGAGATLQGQVSYPGLQAAGIE